MATNDITIGLDIDEKSVKFAKIKRTNGEATLLKYSVKDFPPSEDKAKAVSDILKELFKDEKSDTEVYACAFGANVSLRHTSIPVMPDEEIAAALRWEAKSLIPFPIENSSIAYYKVGGTGEKTSEKFEIMFAVAGEELLTFFKTVSSQSGVRFSGISAVPFALCSALKQGNKCEKDKVNAVIDIGADAASISLFKGDVLHFTREISVAGDSITKAMTGLLVADNWQLNLTYEQAEDIKKKYGIPKKDTSELAENGIPLIHIFEMMAPTLRRLQNEILRSFDYYKEEFREEKIDGVFLTGGSSKLKNLEDYLSNALGIKVETVEPLSFIKVDQSAGINLAELQEVSGRLTLAIGLALDEAAKINLKKGKEKSSRSKGINMDELLKGAKVPMNVNLLAGAGVLLLIGAVMYNMYLSNVRDKYKKELMSKQLILSDIKTLVEKRAIVDQIAREETFVRETLSQISLVLPAGTALTDLTYDNARRQVMITGQANSTKTVGRLLKNFEDSPYFKRTVLIEARKAVIDDVQKFIFKITFSLT